MMHLNKLDLQKLKDRGSIFNYHLLKLDSSDVFPEIVYHSDTSKLETLYIELDYVKLYLDRAKKLVSKSKRAQFDDISDRILTNLENQRDYLMDNYKEYEKWMNG